ncbi:MAG: hypothetical protein M3M94_00555, partial [Actinomycetota bacterium]|nr:hypothetical protein [Actinomycetota bacterium]
MSARTAGSLLPLPVAATGLLVAHAVTYRVAVPEHHDRHNALETTGHAYLAHAPLAIAAAAALLLAALGLRTVASARGDATRSAPPLAIAVLPPLVFLVQEHVERSLAAGAVAWDAAFEAPVAAGVLLQVPF